MEISFTKKSNTGNIISCARKDGTVTWMHIDSFFIMHDLCHFAVEAGLTFKKSFYGMLASGIDINDFELPKEKRPFQLTGEAIFTEQMVNLLCIEYNQGRIENFQETLIETCKEDVIRNFESVMNGEKLEFIRHSFETLMNEWYLLPEGKTMKLIFEE